MLTRYVLADLIRNPRRTLSTMIGVTLGVGLFCGVLFFVDGLSASMTQRAVAPLPIDMQRIVTDPVGGTLELSQSFSTTVELAIGEQAQIDLDVRNTSDVTANETIVRSVPSPNLRFVPGSAQLDGEPITTVEDNPFAHGTGNTGLNIGTIAPGTTHRLSYIVEATTAQTLGDDSIRTSYSSRESISPTAANELAAVPLDQLADVISQIDGVADARQLSFADLGSNTLVLGETTAPGPAKIFGFDGRYASNDPTVAIVDGSLGPEVAVVSAEAATALQINLGDTISVGLPDGSTLELSVSGIADLSQARSLFSSRRGGDLETFIYTPNSVIVSPEVFADTVLPAYERAATTRGARLKNPPVREIDIALDRDRLDSDPSTALIETQRIGAEVSAIASNQDFVLDNISNTLEVAAADAGTAKRLFVFLGVPGGFLAAMLAGYAGTVLADAQRREQATLRIRGASQRHLRRMLAIRSTLLTTVGALVGLALGYLAASAILGKDSLDRASTASLARSAVLGTLGGLFATGLALYITGRRTIDREINEDRARLSTRPPLWRRARIDLVAVSIVALGTLVALRRNAFDGTSGSVYFGRSVELNLALLVLPLAVWMAGSLLAARLFGNILARSQPESSNSIGRPLTSLYRFSVSRRPWAISNGAVIVSLIVALAVSLAAFTASYDAAKAQDARYANGSDIRITPSPTAPESYTADDAQLFQTNGVTATTPVIFSVSNVVLRSDRTSDPANLAAIDPGSFEVVAPLIEGAGPGKLQLIGSDPTGIVLSEDMASFLKVSSGDRLFVLLARATDVQVETEMQILGTFQRLPGFPDGADAVIHIGTHTEHVPSKAPDFFLASTDTSDEAGLETALSALRDGPGQAGHLQIDSRLTTLASDQSSLAALNIAGLVDLDSTFALAMAVVTIAIFVFGLLLQRRREYITLRAQGLESRTIRALIAAEAGTVATTGSIAGVIVGAGMGFYFVSVLRPLFVLEPSYKLPLAATAAPVVLVLLATVITAALGSRMVLRLQPTELLRDE